MRIDPLPGPAGLYNVSVLPRFLLDSGAVGWQGAYFTDIDGAPEGSVDHLHRRLCIQRCLGPGSHRAHGTREWRDFAPGVAVWREGDEQRFDWRRGGRAQFLFVAPPMAESVIGDASRLTPLGHREPAQSRVLELVLDALQTDLGQGSPAGPLVGESLIAALLVHIGGSSPARTLAPAGRGCARAIDLIETRFAEAVTLQDLADASGLGQRQLCRAFRDATGVSPHQYLLRCRVEQAKLLIGRGLSLAEVAVRCGFADQSQLTRTFSAQVGTPPGRYRRGLRS